MSDVIPNTTPLMRALDDTIRGSLHDLAHPLHHLHCPWCCALEVLPHLAWARSVDHWNDRWPEHVKRQVVAASHMVHSVKGSLGAVRRALGSVDTQSAVEEWFETGGAPHTFMVIAQPPCAQDLIADKSDVIFSDALIEELHNVINTARPLRSHHALTLSALGKSAPVFSSGAALSQRSCFEASAEHRDHSGEGKAYVAAGAALGAFSHAAFRAVLPPVPSGLTHVSIKSGAASMQSSHLTMEAQPPL